MTVPKKFRTGDQPLVTFDFVDIADGTGIVRFYGASAHLSTGNNYILTRDGATRAADRADAWAGIGGGGNPRIATNLDFDLSPFNLQQVLRGTLTASVACSAFSTVAAAFTYFIIVKLRHVDEDANETEVASAQSQTFTTNSTASEKKPNQFLVSMAVPRTIYKEKEKIRITVEMWSTPAADADLMGYAFDPSNNFTENIYLSGGGAQSTKTSQIIFDVPFELDL